MYFYRLLTTCKLVDPIIVHIIEDAETRKFAKVHDVAIIAGSTESPLSEIERGENWATNSNTKIRTWPCHQEGSSGIAQF